MLLPKLSLDLLNVLFLPLMVITAFQAWTERKSIWDPVLTPRDRFVLQRIAIFLLLPIVVYLHECGHAIATRAFGGTVLQFHYAFFWGYVIPFGKFTALQVLLIYLAGNVVQAAIGIIALIMAFLVSSPPVVALLVYLGLWSAAGTLILYALMSFSGLYGDWTAIYSAPLPGVVFVIGVIHSVLIALLLYAIYGSRPQLWYARKIQPGFAQQEALLRQALVSQPSAAVWLALGWCYYRSSLFRSAQECLAAATALDPQLPEVTMLTGALYMHNRKYQQSVDCFTTVVSSADATVEAKVRSWLAMADCYIELNQLPKAESAYTQAIETDPTCGDTRYLFALLLVNAGRLHEAQLQLAASSASTWLDPDLKDRAKYLQEQLSKQMAKRSSSNSSNQAQH